MNSMATALPPDTPLFVPIAATRFTTGPTPEAGSYPALNRARRAPYPLAMAAAIAASADFVTPVSSPAVTLVVAPANCGFLDLVKVGPPLLFLTWATTLLVTPIFLPF